MRVLHLVLGLGWLLFFALAAWVIWWAFYSE
jgi:hypothetical protein